MSSLFPSSWCFADIVDLLVLKIWVISAFVLTQQSPCVHVSLHMAFFYKDTSHVRLRAHTTLA